MSSSGLQALRASVMDHDSHHPVLHYHDEETELLI